MTHVQPHGDRDAEDRLSVTNELLGLILVALVLVALLLAVRVPAVVP